MNIVDRNQAAKEYVATLLNAAGTAQVSDFPLFSSETEIHKILTLLIETNAKGFRGLVVTALAGLHLDAAYDPLNNFYGCSPRAIFEQGIWYALQDGGVPCGKSDPLNVAKNVSVLDENWAKGKRPESSAMAVVKFLRKFMAADQAQKALLEKYFFYRLKTYALSITTYNITTVDSGLVSRQDVGSKLVAFTLAYPESGVLPQFLVAQLLVASFQESTVKVVGGEESVFGTNTTSKKPADIWLEHQGSETNLYEITVKPVTHKRLDDSISALSSTGHLNHSVTFICRFPDDIKELNVINGSYSYKEKVFDFVDYKNFCLSLLALITNEQFNILLADMSTLVKDKQISLKTKTGWNDFFG